MESQVPALCQKYYLITGSHHIRLALLTWLVTEASTSIRFGASTPDASGLLPLRVGAVMEKRLAHALSRSHNVLGQIFHQLWDKLQSSNK